MVGVVISILGAAFIRIHPHTTSTVPPLKLTPCISSPLAASLSLSLLPYFEIIGHPSLLLSTPHFTLTHKTSLFLLHSTILSPSSLHYPYDFHPLMSTLVSRPRDAEPPSTRICNLFPLNHLCGLFHTYPRSLHRHAHLRSLLPKTAPTSNYSLDKGCQWKWEGANEGWRARGFGSAQHSQ